MPRTIEKTIRPHAEFTEQVCAGLEFILCYAIEDGVVSWARAAELLNMSLSDFHHLYGKRIGEIAESKYGSYPPS